MNETVLRDGLLVTARAMAASGLNKGTAGNASVRCRDGFLITPSGRPYEDCHRDDMALVAMDGSWRGPFAPSSEWRIHRDILAAHPEAGAVLHAHSPFATALACHRRDIPAFHYMIARFGGSDIRCAPYATFGTQALSDGALAALEGAAPACWPTTACSSSVPTCAAPWPSPSSSRPSANTTGAPASWARRASCRKPRWPR
jgi:L-fuculose-phosphate aldolase